MRSLAYAWQLFANEHINDPLAAEAGLHRYQAVSFVGYLLDDGRAGAAWMRPHRSQDRVRSVRRNDRDQLPFVGLL
jgi:hypothetical protein